MIYSDWYYSQVAGIIPTFQVKHLLFLSGCHIQTKVCLEVCGGKKASSCKMEV